MLNKPIDEIIYENGVAVGIKSEGEVRIPFPILSSTQLINNKRLPRRSSLLVILVTSPPK